MDVPDDVIKKLQTTGYTVTNMAIFDYLTLLSSHRSATFTQTIETVCVNNPATLERYIRRSVNVSLRAEMPDRNHRILLRNTSAV